jgi:GNAT superfamily N-acetyltransferase
MRIIRIEDAQEHIETTAKWLYDEWGRHTPNGSISRAEMELSITPDAHGLPVSFIAVDDYVPVGIARLIANDMETRKDISPWLASVFVLPKCRGRRIGSQLCGQVENEARRLGFPCIYLFTPDRELFYSRLGWTAIERAIYRKKNIVIMNKNLSEQRFVHERNKSVESCETGH